MSSKEEKIKQVEELSQKIQESGAVILSDYRGLSVAEMSQLRKQLSEIGADLKVVKNTLLRFALEKVKLPLSGELKGPTAVLLIEAGDPLESIKALVTFLKAKEKGEVKLGFWEKAAMSAAEVLALAALPGRKVLEARLVAQLASPINKLSYMLSGQSRRLVSVLDRMRKLSEAKSPVAFSEGGTKGGVS